MAKKQANPWIYALGGAVVGGLLLYWWRHRYPTAPVSFHPHLVVYRGGWQGGTAIAPLSVEPSPMEGPTATFSTPAPAPLPVPPAPSPCGCKGGGQPQPQVVVDTWPIQPSPLPQPSPTLTGPQPMPCPRLPGETLMSWQIRCGLLAGVSTRG